MKDEEKIMKSYSDSTEAKVFSLLRKSFIELIETELVVSHRSDVVKKILERYSNSLEKFKQNTNVPVDLNFADIKECYEAISQFPYLGNKLITLHDCPLKLRSEEPTEKEASSFQDPTFVLIKKEGTSDYVMNIYADGVIVTSIKDLGVICDKILNLLQSKDLSLICTFNKDEQLDQDFKAKLDLFLGSRFDANHFSGLLFLRILKLALIQLNFIALNDFMNKIVFENMDDFIPNDKLRSGGLMSRMFRGENVEPFILEEPGRHGSNEAKFKYIISNYTMNAVQRLTKMIEILKTIYDKYPAKEEDKQKINRCVILLKDFAAALNEFQKKWDELTQSSEPLRLEKKSAFQKLGISPAPDINTDSVDKQKAELLNGLANVFRVLRQGIKTDELYSKEINDIFDFVMADIQKKLPPGAKLLYPLSVMEDIEKHIKERAPQQAEEVPLQAEEAHSSSSASMPSASARNRPVPPELAAKAAPLLSSGSAPSPAKDPEQSVSGKAAFPPVRPPRRPPGNPPGKTQPSIPTSSSTSSTSADPQPGSRREPPQGTMFKAPPAVPPKESKRPVPPPRRPGGGKEES